MATDQERADLADSLVNLAQGAMRAAMLINGAGAVAVLAFVGQAWPEKLGPGALASAKCAIVVFTLESGWPQSVRYRPILRSCIIIERQKRYLTIKWKGPKLK